MTPNVPQNTIIKYRSFSPHLNGYIRKAKFSIGIITGLGPDDANEVKFDDLTDDNQYAQINAASVWATVHKNVSTPVFHVGPDFRHVRFAPGYGIDLTDRDIHLHRVIRMNSIAPKLPEVKHGKLVVRAEFTIDVNFKVLFSRAEDELVTRLKTVKTDPNVRSKISDAIKLFGWTDIHDHQTYKPLSTLIIKRDHSIPSGKSIGYSELFTFDRPVKLIQAIPISSSHTIRLLVRRENDGKIDDLFVFETILSRNHASHIGGLKLLNYGPQTPDAILHSHVEDLHLEAGHKQKDHIFDKLKINAPIRLLTYHVNSHLDPICAVAGVVIYYQPIEVKDKKDKKSKHGKQSKSDIEHTQLITEVPKVIEASKPVTDNVKPTNEASKPVTDNVKPTNEAPKPVTDNVKPTNEAPKPVTDNVKPTNEAPKPVTDNVKPTSEVADVIIQPVSTMLNPNIKISPVPAAGTPSPIRLGDDIDSYTIKPIIDAEDKTVSH